MTAKKKTGKTSEIEKILKRQRCTLSWEGQNNRKRIDYYNIYGIGFIDEKTNKIQNILPNFKHK